MKVKNLIYLSHPYTSDTPTYGDRDQMKITSNSSIEMGDTANSSRWVFTNNHIGTHVDVPFHFDLEGRRILDFSPEERIFQNVSLADIPCDKARLIDEKDLINFLIDPNIELLLIRTGYEKYRSKSKYWEDSPGLSPTLPDYLRRHFPRLRCIGFDFISITSWQHRDIGRESHLAFLKPPKGDKPILAIEDMSLVMIDGALDWIIASPLLVADGNGAPVTIFANMREKPL